MPIVYRHCGRNWRHKNTKKGKILALIMLQINGRESNCSVCKSLLMSI